VFSIDDSSLAVGVTVMMDWEGLPQKRVKKGTIVSMINISNYQIGSL